MRPFATVTDHAKISAMKSIELCLVGALLLAPLASVGCSDDGGTPSAVGGGAGGSVGGGAGGGTGAGGGAGGGTSMDDGGAGGGGGMDAGMDDGGAGGGGGMDDGGTQSDGGPVVDASLDGAVFTCSLVACEAKGGTCDFDIDLCEIPGNPDVFLSCPAGSTCTFDCTGARDCTGATVECVDSTSCDVRCDVGHCEDTLCAPPTCTCSGAGGAECVTGD